MVQRAARDRLIVGLDYPDAGAALALVDRLGDDMLWYKVGLELYTAEGPAIVRALREREKHVFLDVKFHDIPNTVAGAARVVGGLGVRIFNVHTVGGSEMMRAATTAAHEGAAKAALPPPLVYGVTVLTSLSDRILADELGIPATAQERVLALATLAQQSGLDGVVASPREVRALRERCGPAFGVLTPGIRPAGSALGDQHRVATPADAVRDGADYLVVSRPIREAADPVSAAKVILDEIARALD